MRFFTRLFQPKARRIKKRLDAAYAEWRKAQIAYNDAVSRKDKRDQHRYGIEASRCAVLCLGLEKQMRGAR